MLWQGALRIASRISPLVGLGLPLLLGAILIFRFGENVCIYDEFRVALPLQAYDAGRLTFDHFWEQHVDHRIALPLAVLFVLALATGFNSLAGMWAAWVVFAVILLTWFLAYRRLLGDRDRHSIGFLPIAWLAYSFSQYENFLNSFQLVFVFPLGLGLPSLYLLSRRANSGRHFAVAVVLATLASGSCAMGLFVWFAGLVPLLLSTERRRRFLTIGIWTLLGIVVWILYFWNFTFVGETRPHLLEEPVNFARFVARLLGHSLVAGSGVAECLGLLLIGLAGLATLLSLRSGSASRHSFFLAVLAFAGLNAMSIAQGRLAFGLEQAGISRYATYTIPLVVATAIILLDLTLRSRQVLPRVALGLLGAICLWAVPMTYYRGFAIAERHRDVMRVKAIFLRTFDHRRDVVLQHNLSPWVDDLRSAAAFLRRKRYNVFGREDLRYLEGPR